MAKEKTSYRIEKGLRIFKTTYKDARGTTCRSENWYVEFRDHQRIIRRLPAFTERQQSTDLARRVKKLVAWKVSGELPDADMQRWIETMPDKLRNTLARWDILDARRVAAGKPLSDHLDDWKSALLAKGNTDRHAELVTSRTRKVITGCGFKSWSELSASKVQSYLADLRQDCKDKDGNTTRGIGAQTFNFYLQAVKQFARWMVRDGRASESPLAHLDGLNVKIDRRHDRRALSIDELRLLLEVTENGRNVRNDDDKLIKLPAVERFGMTGTARAMLYRLAVETGLRSAELRSLTRASFNLDDHEPAVTIAAAYAKNRRQDTLPLKPETAIALGTYLSGKMPQAQAFNMPVRTEVIRMFRADLTDARAAWIAEPPTPQQRAERAKSTILAEQDESGRYADFHALRHTFITGLVTGGVNPKVAQTLARHSVITLTMDRYTHLYQGNLAAALDVLPNLSQPTKQVQAATGTDGVPAKTNDPRLARFLAHFDGVSGERRSQGGLNHLAKEDSPSAPNEPEKAGNAAVLTDFPASAIVLEDSRRSGRAVECAGLENR